MNEDKGFIDGYVKKVLISFAACVIAVSIVGWFVGDLAKEEGGLLRLGRDGLSYVSLLQLFAYSLIMSGVEVLLFSNYFIKRMMMLWRTVFMFVLTYLTAILFSVLFGWFPINSMEAWLSFFLSITGCSFVILLLIIIKTKLEDKKYHKLLSDYKAKKKQERGDSQ